MLEAVDSSGGIMLTVEEDEILPARDQLAGLGLYVEPTSAVVWAALQQALSLVQDPIVLVLTGHGLKSTASQ